MAYGDAYIYAVVIPSKVAPDIISLENEYRRNLRICSEVRVPLEDVDEATRKRWRTAYDTYRDIAVRIEEILRANVIHLVYITCDSPNDDDIYYRLERCGYKPIRVNNILTQWGKEIGREKLGDYDKDWVVFQPVHQDEEEEFLYQFGYRKSRGCAKRIKEHICVYDYENRHVDGKYLFPDPSKSGLARFVEVDAWCVSGKEGIVAFFFYDRFLCEAHGDDGHWWLVGIMDKAWVDEFKETVARIEGP